MRWPLSLIYQQKGACFALFHEMSPERKIAEYTNKSKTTVHSFIAAEGMQKMLNGPKEIAPTLRFACISGCIDWKYCGRDLRRNLDFSTSFLHIQQFFSSSNQIMYNKNNTFLVITLQYKRARLERAKEHFTWSISHWNEVILADKYRFNFDYPNGFMYYWHNLRKDTQYFCTLHQGWKSVMVWSAVSYYAELHIFFISTKKDSTL